MGCLPWTKALALPDGNGKGMGKRLPKGPNGRKIRRATAMKAAALITRQTLEST